MNYVLEVEDPFNPWKAKKRVVDEGRLSIRCLLAKLYGEEFVDFTRPTIISVNGKWLLRKLWSDIIEEGAVIQIVTAAPGYVVLFWIWQYLELILLAVAAVATVVLAIQHRLPGQQKLGTSSNPVYTLAGQNNQSRLGDPIEVQYGLIKRYPSYCAQPYQQYYNNQQYLFQLFCIGQGAFDIDSINIGSSSGSDTPITNFNEIEYQVVPPGGSVTLFPTDVLTSTDVQGITLLGPNQTGYTPIGPFVVNPPDSVVNQIEIDVGLPGGLYKMKSDGSLEDETVEVRFVAQQIDDSGAPIGSPFTMFDQAWALQTNAPQYFTLRYDLTGTGSLGPPGRYTITAHRVNDKDTSQGVSDEVAWIAMRGFMNNVTDFGGVTLLAVKALADYNLNDQTSQQFNVLCTRKLPIFDPDSGTWLPAATTRSAVWAFCDVLRSTYGAQIADAYLDMPSLIELNDDLIVRGDWFDWTFDQNTTIWAALQAIGLTVRSVPTLVGPKLTLVRDAPQAIPVAVFTPENTVKGSWQWQLKLPGYNYNDGMVATYVDPSTYLPEIVDCFLPELSELGNNALQVTMAGITQRNQAYHEGMYQRASIYYIRENIIFETGLEGFIPSYGDLVLISCDIPRWSQYGMIKRFSLSSGGSTVMLQLNNQISFASSGMVLGVRYKDGSLKGPWAVSATLDPYVVKLTGVTGFPTDMPFDGISEFPLYVAGPASTFGYQGRVVAVEPATDDTVKITCSNYNPQIYSYDILNAPTQGNTYGSLPPPPGAPTPTNLQVGAAANLPGQAIATWNPIPGIKYYTLQISYDGFTWQDAGGGKLTQPMYTFSVLPMFLYVRVNAVGTGAGNWDYWFGNPFANITPVIPAAVGAFAGTGRSVNVTWVYDTTVPTEYFLIYRGVVNSFSATSTIVIGRSKTNNFVDAGVALGTTYYYWIVAVSIAFISSAPSSSASCTTNNGPVDPDTPPNPTASSITTGAYVDGVGKVVAYIDCVVPPTPTGSALTQVKFRQHGVSPAGWITIDAPPAGATIRIDNLATSQAYDVVTQAFDAYFNPSGEVTATGSPITTAKNVNTPAVVTGVNAVAGQGAAIGLSWNASASTDINYYKIYRNTVNNFSTATVIGVAYATSFTDLGQNGGLTNGTTYYYWVTALNTSGHESSSSGVSSAAPTQSSLKNPTAPSTPTSPALADAGGVQQSSDGTIWSYEDITVTALPSGAVYQKLLFRINGVTNWNIVDGFLGNTGSITCPVYGLTPGVAYDFGIQAFNESGLASSIATLTNQIAPSKTSAPFTPTSGNLSSTGAPASYYGVGPSLGFGCVVSFTGVTDADLIGYEVKATNTDSDPATDYNWFNSMASGGGLMLVPASPGAVVVSLSIYSYFPSPLLGFVRVRALNASGIRSGWLRIGNAQSSTTLGAGTISTQAQNASALTGVAIGSLIAGSVQAQSALNQKSSVLTTTGGSPFEDHDINITGLGFSSAVSTVIVNAVYSGGTSYKWLASYDPGNAAQSSTNMRIRLYTNDNTNLPASTSFRINYSAFG